MLGTKNIIAVFLLAAVLVPTQSLAIDVDPRDYTALPASIGIYRFVHFTKFMGLTIDPQVLVPFGKLEAFDISSSGTGDAIFATTFWLHENPEKGEYFGITPFVIAPTGSYDSGQPINIGTNRWSYVLGEG